MKRVYESFLPQIQGHWMQFQHSSERDKLQTTTWVRFHAADHDTSTFQSCNMHNRGKNNLVWEPVFQFVQAFQILYKDYGKHLRESFRELWSNMFWYDSSNDYYDTTTYHNAYTDTHDNTFQSLRLSSSGF